MKSWLKRCRKRGCEAVVEEVGGRLGRQRRDEADEAPFRST